MKKLIALILALAMLSSMLVACKDDKKDEPKKSETVTETEETPDSEKPTETKNNYDEIGSEDKPNFEEARDEVMIVERILPVIKNVSSDKKKFRVAPSVRGNVASIFAQYCEKIHHIAPEVTNDAAGIVFAESEGLCEEEYIIKAEGGRVTVLYSTTKGANRGAATLIGLLEEENGDIYINDLYLNDAPDNNYRGLMVDVARKFHPFDALLNYIDMCWLLKLNVFHAHFSDFQGYRLPSKLFENLPSEKSYTKLQIEILNKYAEERGIMIVPEIDLPGHATALVQGSEGAFGDAKNEEHRHIICLGSEDVFENIRNLIKEVADLFPNSKYIHLGGDEADIAVWDKCEKCRSFMEKNSIDNAKQMYSKFIKFTTDYVLDIGRIPMVWEGFPKDGDEDISRRTVVMEFESLYQTSDELLESGFNIINTSWQPLYVVPERYIKNNPRYFSEEEVYNWNKMTWKNFYHKSKAYKHPIVSDDKYKDNVLGGQLCVWEMFYHQELRGLMEVLPMFAERSWNENCRLDYEKAATITEKYRNIIKCMLRDVRLS